MKNLLKEDQLLLLEVVGWRLLIWILMVNFNLVFVIFFNLSMKILILFTLYVLFPPFFKL